MIERILNNEGFQPAFIPLAQHRLKASVADSAPWLAQARVAELPQAGAVRLANLIERSGKDVPLLFITAAEASDLPPISAMIDTADVTKSHLGRLSAQLDRLYAQRENRCRLSECRLHYEQLQRCCYQVFDAAQQPIAILNGDGHIYANPAYMQLFNYAEFPALKKISLSSLLSEPDADKVAAMLKRVDEKYPSAARDISVHGVPMRMELTRFPGASQGVQVMLKTLNMRSVQSGLLSRRDWLRALKQRETATDPTPAAVFYIKMLGLDQLQKAIGYAQCDVLLSELSTAIMTLLPEHTSIALLENNVFAALIQDGDLAGLTSLAKQLSTAIAERVFKFADLALRVRLTIGICRIENNCSDNERFIVRAADAAHRAEHQGGVGVHQQAAPPLSNDDHALWVGRVAKALKDDNLFSILYQPIVNLNGGSGACYEALLRMHNEGGGEYLPGKFMPSALQAGLMGFIDRWVIRSTCKLIKTEAAQGRSITMFVNISRESLVSEEFCTGLAQLINSYKIDPKAFVFEVSEADVMLYGSRCEPVLSGIRALGCAIALEHFSGAEAAFSLLDNLEVDFIKLDAVLVRGLSNGRAGRERIASLAHDITARGKQSIAGCVQDAEAVAQLWQCGVNYVQGYFLQHPSKALDYDFLSDTNEAPVSGES